MLQYTGNPQLMTACSVTACSVKIHNDAEQRGFMISLHSCGCCSIPRIMYWWSECLGALLAIMTAQWAMVTWLPSVSQKQSCPHHLFPKEAVKEHEIPEILHSLTHTHSLASMLVHMGEKKQLSFIFSLRAISHIWNYFINPLENQNLSSIHIMSEFYQKGFSISSDRTTVLYYLSLFKSIRSKLHIIHTVFFQQTLVFDCLVWSFDWEEHWGYSNNLEP